MTKPAQQPEVMNKEWLSLPEAIRQLGKSQSTVERLVANDAISTKLEPRIGRKPERLYSASDVQKIANQGTQVRAIAVARPPTTMQLAIQPEAMSALHDAMKEWGNGRGVSLKEKLWLSLEEAAEYSGLSVSFIRDSMVDPVNPKRGEIVGIRGGPHGAWRILRASLENFSG